MIQMPTSKMRNMNTDYIIYITTKKGRTWRYVKEKKGWVQTAPTGKVRQITAEQLLSHLLPPLAFDQPNLNIKIERRGRTNEKE